MLMRRIYVYQTTCSIYDTCKSAAYFNTFHVFLAHRLLLEYSLASCLGLDVAVSIAVKYCFLERNIFVLNAYSSSF